MKSRISTICAVLLAAASCVPVLSAQSNVNLKMRVPFPFQYGTVQFAPGLCQGDMLNPETLRLTCGSRTSIKIAVYGTLPLTSRTSFAVFKKYGNRYFLEEIRLSDARITIIESQAEKHAARELEARGESPSLVEVGLLEKLPASHGRRISRSSTNS